MKTLLTIKDYEVQLDPYQYIITGGKRKKYTTSLSRAFEIILRYLQENIPNDDTSKRDVRTAMREYEQLQADFLADIKKLLNETKVSQIEKTVEKLWTEQSQKRSQTP